MRNARFNIILTAAVFIVMEAAALSMLSHRGTMQGAWIARAGHGFMGAVWGRIEGTTRYFSLGRENAELAARNAALEAELRRLRAEGTAQALPEDSFGSCYRLTPATIEKMSLNHQHNYIILSKGAEDGIRPLSGIITGRGVVGIVTGVSRRHCFGRLFMNTDMAVSARLGRDGETGSLRWDGVSAGRAVLTDIPQHIEVARGDTVFTSGFSSIFPPDIPLGTVMNKDVVDGASYEIDIELFENFRRLRHVSIVENLDLPELEELEK